MKFIKKKSTATAAALICVCAFLIASPVKADTSVITLPPGVAVAKDVPYGKDPLQTMDIYYKTERIPATGGVPGKLSPVIFMVHGGGWRRGDKADTRVVQNKMSRWVPDGFVFISINYRLLPTSVADQAGDVNQALAVAQRLAPKWGGDSAKFILMGHSAGAHLISLVSSDPRKAYANGAQPWLGTISLDSAVLNVPELMSLPHLPLYDDAFGSNPLVWKALSPYDQLTRLAKPFMTVCSTQRVESCPQSKQFDEKAEALGDRTKDFPVDLTHKEINAYLGLTDTPLDAEYTRNVEYFMASLDRDVAVLLGNH